MSSRRTMPTPLGYATLVLSLSIGVAVFAAAATAAPPSNDNFANAEVLGGAFPIVLQDTTSEATSEPGEPGYGDSVWYVWTAGGNRQVAIDTCGGSSFSPNPNVYTGSSVSGLQPVPSRDDYARTTRCPLPDPQHDDPGDGYDVVEFEARAGTTYRIQVQNAGSDGGPFGLVLGDPEVYDLAISQAVSRRRVPLGGTVRELLKVTNRGNVAFPSPPNDRAAFGQEINRPGMPHYPGKAIYASATSPGGRCSKGTFGPSTIQTFACDVVRLAPGESQTATVKVTRIRGAILLDAHVAIQDDRRGNDDAQAVVRVRRRG
jgi:hypothetical protein